MASFITLSAGEIGALSLAAASVSAVLLSVTAKFVLDVGLASDSATSSGVVVKALSLAALLLRADIPPAATSTASSAVLAVLLTPAITPRS